MDMPALKPMTQGHATGKAASLTSCFSSSFVQQHEMKQEVMACNSMHQCHHNTNSDVIASQLKQSSQVTYQQCSTEVAATQLLKNVQISLCDIATASSSCTHRVAGLMQLQVCAVTQSVAGSSQECS
ncbi:TPA: hypothetical protein ACH3X3_001240 [Trebouxia sp. C0006]